MRDFTTDTKFNINSDKANEAFLFEHLEDCANGMRFQVQEKNEAGKWGGRGNDVEFTFPGHTTSRARVIEFYRDCVLPELSA
jgi:hypothetical protein